MGVPNFPFADDPPGIVGISLETETGVIDTGRRLGRAGNLRAAIVIPALCFFVLAVMSASGQPLAGCCELRIEVRGAAQESLAGASVDVSGPGRILSDRTGSNGSAGFTLPRPGAYTVSASKEGYIRLSR